MTFAQIMEDVQRGWSAPILLVIVSTLMTVPITALAITLMGGVFKVDVGTATAFAAIIQVIGTFWIAGYRLRRGGR